MGKHKNDESTLVMQHIVDAMQDKKANNITSLDLRKIPNSVTNYFVICDVSSKIHSGAVYDNILKFVKEKMGLNPYHKEGMENAEWILLDYFDVVVHIFTEDARKFYNLEGLWADAERKDYENIE